MHIICEIKYARMYCHKSYQETTIQYNTLHYWLFLPRGWLSSSSIHTYTCMSALSRSNPYSLQSAVPSTLTVTASILILSQHPAAVPWYAHNSLSTWRKMILLVAYTLLGIGPVRLLTSRKILLILDRTDRSVIAPERLLSVKLNFYTLELKLQVSPYQLQWSLFPSYPYSVIHSSPSLAWNVLARINRSLNFKFMLFVSVYIICVWLYILKYNVRYTPLDSSLSQYQYLYWMVAKCWFWTNRMHLFLQHLQSLYNYYLRTYLQ